MAKETVKKETKGKANKKSESSQEPLDEFWDRLFLSEASIALKYPLRLPGDTPEDIFPNTASNTCLLTGDLPPIIQSSF